MPVLDTNYSKLDCAEQCLVNAHVDALLDALFEEGTLAETNDASQAAAEEIYEAVPKYVLARRPQNN